MDLFQNPDENLLPQDGTLLDLGCIYSIEESQRLFDELLTSANWKNDEVTLFGKKHITARKTAWYGTKDFAYTYSNSTRFAEPFTGALLGIKGKVEDHLKESFNSCLLNLYHDGNEGMGYHADDEKDLVRHGSIASLSLGATRKFVFKHNTQALKKELILHPGHLIVMKDEIQDFWKHALPKSKKVKAPRINLTFRNIRTN